MKKMKFIDLFSGIGGFRKAIELVQHDLKFIGKCIGFSEIDKYAIKSYKANFQTQEEVELGDIEKYLSEIDAFNYIPDFDILFGGFPCQPFSLMGKKLGTEDSRGNLFLSVIKVLSYKKPKYFLLENVRNLYKLKNGDIYKMIKMELSSIGYNVEEDIFNTSDFGLPQHRRRLYIFGIRNDLKWKQKSFNQEDIANYFKKIQYKSVMNFSSVVEGLLELNNVDEKYYLSEKIKKTILSDGTKNFKSKSEINQLIARPLTATMVKMHRACQDNYYSQEFLNSEDKHEYLKIKLPKEIECQHRIRKITPKEALKLQGFDEKFYNNIKNSNVSDFQIYKQAGNAVSVNVVYAILHYLIFNNLIKLK